LKDVELEAVPDETALADLATPSHDKLLECIVRAGEAVPNPASPLAGEGVGEAGLIVPAATSDGFLAGPIRGWWPHGFNLRELALESGAYIPMHARQEEEVLLVQTGTLEVSWDDASVTLGAGDTLTVPIGLPHAFRNTASVRCEVFVVRGGDDPKMPLFSSAPTA
jgi:mannose-6-phosphate isomerase-like protein (cupin superfamily)